MKIFEDIKSGILPDNNILLEVYKNNIIDEKNIDEIKKYIMILNNSFENATTEEKILLNRVIFILEMLINEPDALKNFISKAFTLHVHKIDDDYLNFLEQFLLVVDETQLFNILNELMKDIYKLPKEEMRSFFNWILHFVWNISKYYNNVKFKNFYNNLKELLYKLRDANRIADMMYVEFFTYHIMGNSFQKTEEWKEFNKNVTQETIKGYNQFINNLSTPKKSKKNKQRIGFIKERIGFNSPYMVEYSLFKNLMENEKFKNNYEIYLYTFNQFEKNVDDDVLIKELDDLGIKVRRVVDYFAEEGYYNNHLNKALTLRENIIEDDIDIMIAGTGVFPIVNFLFVTRTAPLQIYYSHGNCAYDVPNIDKRVSHFNQECTEFEWNIINIPMAEEFLVGTDGERIVAEIIKQDYKNKFGEDVVILGTIGRLVKIDSDEYIKTIAKIMKDNPNTIYLACGLGNEENIKEKLKKYNIDEKRFIFTGLVKAHVYGWVIDVWPDSFPHLQGQSRNEFEAKGGSIVGLKNLYPQNFIDSLSKITDEDILANDREDYIKKANRLIQNDKYRAKIGNIFKKRIQLNTFDYEKFKGLLS